MEKALPENNKRNWALAALCAGIFLAAIDQTVVVAVLPGIIDDLEGGFSSSAVERAGWIVTSYLFGYTVVLPLMGRVADRFGYRRTYLMSIVIFTAGSVLCSLSWSLYAMVGFRAIQAIGGGAMVPIAMAAASHSFPRAKRALVLAVIGAAAEAGGVLGPIYGAVLGEFIGWRAIFYLNVPLVLVIMWLVIRKVPASIHHEADAKIDYRSGALLALALGAATAGISGGREFGWSGFGLPLLALAALLTAGFLASDLRSDHPLIDTSLYRNRFFASANIAHFLLGVALITALVQVPTFAYASTWPEQAPDDALAGGLLLMRLTLMIPVGALAGGLAAGRFGSRLTAVSGFVLSAAGLWLISGWHVDSGEVQKTAALTLAGFGFGIVIAPISVSAVNVLKKGRMASGAAVLTASRIIGMTVGLAAINSWGIREFRMTSNPMPAAAELFGEGFGSYVERLRIWEQNNVEVILGVLSNFFLIAAITCALAIVPALFFQSRR